MLLRTFLYAFPLQKDCELENRENEEEQERLKGTAVQYGQKVQVYTSMSQLHFLCGHVHTCCHQNKILMKYCMLVNTNSDSIA